MKFTIITAPTTEEIATRAAQYLWNYKIAAGVIPDGQPGSSEPGSSEPGSPGYVIQVPSRKVKSAQMYLIHWAEEEKRQGKV